MYIPYIIGSNEFGRNPSSKYNFWPSVAELIGKEEILSGKTKLTQILVQQLVNLQKLKIRIKDQVRNT